MAVYQTFKWQVYEIITVSQSTVQYKVVPLQMIPAIPYWYWYVLVSYFAGRAMAFRCRPLTVDNCFRFWTIPREILVDNIALGRAFFPVLSVSSLLPSFHQFLLLNFIWQLPLSDVKTSNTSELSIKPMFFHVSRSFGRTVSHYDSFSFAK